MLLTTSIRSLECGQEVFNMSCEYNNWMSAIWHYQHPFIHKQRKYSIEIMLKDLNLLYT